MALTVPPVYLIFVPGITGTSLMKQGDTLDVWWEQVYEHRKDAATVLQLMSDTTLLPDQPIQSILDVEQVYGPLINYFTGLGYQYVTYNGSANVPTSGNILVGVGYDWRYANEQSAAELANLVKFINANAPDPTIWLVAHSMGGLVSRYFLESGSFDTTNVKGLITAATPHLGAPFALSAVTGQASQSALLGATTMQELIDEPKFVSAYELMPPPSVPFVYDSTGSESYSVYDTSSPVYQLLIQLTNTGFGAPPDHIAAAQSFWGSLNYQGALPYYVAYGSGLPTVESFLYDPSGSSPVQDLVPQQNITRNGGDGTVPAWSTNLANATGSFNAGNVTHAGMVTDEYVLAQINMWINGG